MDIVVVGDVGTHVMCQIERNDYMSDCNGCHNRYRGSDEGCCGDAPILPSL